MNLSNKFGPILWGGFSIKKNGTWQTQHYLSFLLQYFPVITFRYDPGIRA